MAAISRPVDGPGVDQRLEVGQAAVSHDFEAVRAGRLCVNQGSRVLAHVPGPFARVILYLI
jgi:hypothetical protein